MKASYFPYLLILVLAIALFLLLRRNETGNPDNQSRATKKATKNKPASTATNARGLNRDYKTLILTKHAKCRMACRQITLNEVEDIIENGVINYRKSEIDASPEYAVEGYSKDQQHIRVVVAQEKTKLILITCIDLEKEWKCDCD